MRRTAHTLLGIYLPGDTWWHRISPGWKYLAFLVLTLPVMVVPVPGVAAAGLALALALVVTTGAPPRLAWGMPWALVALLAVLGGYHALVGQWTVGVRVVATIMTALYASRLILFTTPMPALVDALVAFVSPLRRVCLDPERFGLAVVLMIRSVPYLVASFGEVRDAARARGIERNPLALVTPVVVSAVAYARSTGEALAARGLGESE